MPQRHSPSVTAAPQTGPAALPQPGAKWLAAASAQDPPELSDAPRSAATVVFAAAPDIPGGNSGSPTNDPAVRASPCPSRLHPDKARTTASPRGTSVLLFSPCPS